MNEKDRAGLVRRLIDAAADLASAERRAGRVSAGRVVVIEPEDAQVIRRLQQQIRAHRQRARGRNVDTNRVGSSAAGGRFYPHLEAESVEELALSHPDVQALMRIAPETMDGLPVGLDVGPRSEVRGPILVEGQIMDEEAVAQAVSEALANPGPLMLDAPRPEVVPPGFYPRHRHRFTRQIGIAIGPPDLRERMMVCDERRRNGAACGAVAVQRACRPCGGRGHEEGRLSNDCGECYGEGWVVTDITGGGEPQNLPGHRGVCSGCAQVEELCTDDTEVFRYCQWCHRMNETHPEQGDCTGCRFCNCTACSQEGGAAA